MILFQTYVWDLSYNIVPESWVVRYLLPPVFTLKFTSAMNPTKYLIVERQIKCCGTFMMFGFNSVLVLTASVS